MQRRLIIMRHAKSDWDSGANTDHERPLNKRGRQDAPRIAAELVDRHWQPQTVLSSDSIRTRETMERMQEYFAPALQVEFLESLYHAGIREIEDAVSLVPDDCETVLVLGHNPGWQKAVFLLSGTSAMMTTANAALLSIESKSWAKSIAQRGAWTLHEVLRPKELPSK